MLRSLFNTKRLTHKTDRNCFVPSVVALEAREVPAVTASFSAVTGTLSVFGDNNNNSIVISRTAGGTLRVNDGAVKIKGGTATVTNTTQIRIDGRAGNDTLRLNEANGVLPAAVLIGGNGNDKMFGGSGNDTFNGGAGNDQATGRKGNDTATLGAGNDEFVWNPGDGSDTIEGQGGIDTMTFVGAAVNEAIDISANGQRLKFFRDVGNVTMDANDLENVVFHALGGSDTITVNDLSGTDVTDVKISLANAVGGKTGDAQPDVVIVNGTNGNDTLTARTSGLETLVTTPSARVHVTWSDALADQLQLIGLDGNDTISASALALGRLQIFADGGAGNDTLTGSTGDDILFGGDGNDIISALAGNDVLFGNDGDDVLQAATGDDILDGGVAGDDVLDGGTGDDILLNGEVNLDA